MGRSCVVPVTRIADIKQHPNADKLELATVLGYQVCVPVGQFKAGDKVVYFPADIILPDEQSIAMGVKEYMQGPDKNKVAKIRLRGEPSFGFCKLCEGSLQGHEVGTNLAELFGAEQYVPPITTQTDGVARISESQRVLFDRYTDIENGRIFNDVFEPHEQVIAMEKIHGTNSRVGYLHGQVIMGSHNLPRKCPVDCYWDDFDAAGLKASVYWSPITLEPIRDLIKRLSCEAFDNFIIYGEIYGGSIFPKAKYGIEKGRGLGFRVFDIKVEDSGKVMRYLNWEATEKWCISTGVETVPVLYRGPFITKVIEKLSNGLSTVDVSTIREGVVVRSKEESHHPKVGRKILKFIGDDFELSKASR